MCQTMNGSLVSSLQAVDCNIYLLARNACLVLSGWQNNLQQLQQPQHALPKPKIKQIPTAQHMQPSADLSKSQKETDCHDPEEMTVPFDGAHLLECYGMAQYDTVLSLERFLQQMQWSSVCPVVRYIQCWNPDCQQATASLLFCRSAHSCALPIDVTQAEPFLTMRCFAQCFLHFLQKSITAMQLAAQTLVALVCGDAWSLQVPTRLICVASNQCILVRLLNKLNTSQPPANFV